MARQRGGRNLRLRSSALINDDLFIDPGPDTVAWRQKAADGSGVVSNVVLTRRGTTMVALVAYGLRDEPHSDVLTAALAALPQ